MFIPAQSAPNPTRAQVAVIGAGPAGMAVSMDLARRGINVALLSSGGFGPDNLSADLSKPQSISPHHAPPDQLEARRFGGMSHAWGGRCVALDPIDFDPRPDGDLPGWPISRAALETHATDAAEFLGIGPATFDDTRAEGLDGIPVRLERWAAQPVLAKAHKPTFATDTRLQVYLDLTCSGAAVDEHGRITSVQAKRPDGSTLRVEAHDFVFAAGGIETARLLLWLFGANGRTAPAWTGRGYMGHIKGHMLKLAAPPTTAPALEYRQEAPCFVRQRLCLDEETLRRSGLPNINFWLDNLPLGDASHGLASLSLVYLALRMPGVGKKLLPTAMRHYFLSQSDGRVAGHFRNLARNPISAARFCVSLWAERRRIPVRPGRLAWPANGYLPLTFSAEERPRFSNAVTLGDATDMFGVPRSAIRRELHEDDLDAVIAANAQLAERLTHAGFSVLPSTAQRETLHDALAKSSGDGFHQIGTARMGQNADDAVIDSNCRVFGLQNAFVGGSAAFPRSGQANPTFSIVCLSFRLAAFLADRQNNGVSN